MLREAAGYVAAKMHSTSRMSNNLPVKVSGDPRLYKNGPTKEAVSSNMN
jgi:hypothetical protein